MLKKLGILLMVVIMAFAATGCKKEEAPKATDAPVVTEAPAEEKADEKVEEKADEKAEETKEEATAEEEKKKP